MSITKGIQDLTKKFSAIKKLQEMGLMKAFADEPVVYIYPELWLGKDQTYVKQWCQNVLTVWGIKHPVQYKKLGKNTVLEVRHIEDSAALCRYDEVNGLVLIGR
ncbi:MULTISPECIES: hypothetical protein [Sphingobacterium]|uniref:Uncharacterized protein n=1 Tax=Sphingobacterium populi TaxID=1812824 RepID=A0ABW5U806_9SPHI|nr:hypothetical protein [Sphingobacterium sp. CFCC 11742]